MGDLIRERLLELEKLGPGQSWDAEKPAGLDQGARPIGGREALPEGVTGRRAGVTEINVEALDSHGIFWPGCISHRNSLRDGDLFSFPPPCTMTLASISHIASVSSAS